MKLHHLHEDQYDDLMGKEPLPDQDQYGEEPNPTAIQIAHWLNKVNAIISDETAELEHFSGTLPEVQLIKAQRDSPVAEELSDPGYLTAWVLMQLNKEQQVGAIDGTNQLIHIDDDTSVRLFTIRGSEQWVVLDASTLPFKVYSSDSTQIHDAMVE